MPEDLKIKHIRLEQMHGHQTLELELLPGLNIIYGKNGTGKTTLLHTLVNLMENDLERFIHIRFGKVEITTYGGDTFKLIQNIKDSGEIAVTVFYNEEQVGTIPDEIPGRSEAVDFLSKHFTKRPVYLPAYRPILEGTLQNRRYFQRSAHDFSDAEYQRIVERETSLLKEKRETLHSTYYLRDAAELIAFKTLMCRSWFGNFVPVVRYPSITEVHRELEDELERARYIVAAQDERNISTVFRKVLEVALSKNQPEITEDIDALVDRVRRAVIDFEPASGEVPNVYSELAGTLKNRLFDPLASSDKIKGILKVYDDALSNRSKSKADAYSSTDTFLDSVNKFLENKPIGYEYKKIPNRVRRKSFITLPDGRHVGFNVLSSGERHILTLLFSATHMSPADGIVFIDEPELSLHIDWQRIILGEISKQAKDRQIIACTHSPEVAADHMDAYKELVNLPTLANVLEISTDDPDQTEPDLEA